MTYEINSAGTLKDALIDYRKNALIAYDENGVIRNEEAATFCDDIWFAIEGLGFVCEYDDMERFLSPDTTEEEALMIADKIASENF